MWFNNDERQTFFDKHTGVSTTMCLFKLRWRHAGGEGKTPDNNKFARLFVLIVFVKNADIFLTTNSRSRTNQASFSIYFFICFSVFLISFSIETNCFVINA